MHPPVIQPEIVSPAVGKLRAYRASVYARGHALTEQDKQIPTFPTGITAARGDQLRDLLCGERPARTIETGFALGLSSLYILEASLTCSPAFQVLHTAIDPYQRSDWGDAGLRTVREAGLAEQVLFFAADSALVLPALAAAEEEFDVAFVDGSHLFDGVFIDIFYMLRLVRPGGLIVLDDYWMPAIQTAVEFFVKNMGVHLTLLPDEKGRPRLAALRTGSVPVSRDWDHFASFARTP